MRQRIIFTDLDGTLLDYSTYSFQKAAPALKLIREKDIPLVLCSSKTRSEIEYYRERLDNHHPFVSENGGGVFIPRGYFQVTAADCQSPCDEEGGYVVIRLGAAYPDLRNALLELRREGLSVKGFGDMSAEELARITHLSIEEAIMAKERDFDEPFLFDGRDEETDKLEAAIRAKGFCVTQGRFFHIVGDSDKGRAVAILSALYEKKFQRIMTIALGDSPNDISMLERVDYPVVVEKPGGNYDVRINLPNLKRADGVGPVGWNRAVLALLHEEEPKL